LTRHGSDPLAQSVHDRLRKTASETREQFNAVLARYGMERLLFRLSRTPHGKRFVLKGAMLFVLWLDRLHRPTLDVDLLGSEYFDQQALRSMFEDVCRVKVKADGLQFDPDSITVEEIRESQRYQGLRVKVPGHLGSARLTVQVDVGFGDVITPAPVEADYPTLLDLPAPRLKTYPAETVVAEKTDAIIEFGLRNSRMKDYYDLWMLCSHFDFVGASLAAAIQATLRRRHRELPTVVPSGLSDDFGEDTLKQQQWSAFLRRNRLADVQLPLLAVVHKLREFLVAPLQAVSEGRSFEAQWPAGGPWHMGR